MNDLEDWEIGSGAQGRAFGRVGTSVLVLKGQKDFDPHATVQAYGPGDAVHRQQTTSWSGSTSASCYRERVMGERFGVWQLGLGAHGKLDFGPW